jgi:pimeloyl-ACP methyl ester carboxylesterase
MRPVLLFLHGWGGAKDSWDPLRAALSDIDAEILTPDLPGFGEQPDPSKPWTVDDYADWAESWLRVHRRSTGPLFVVGHSHGGRIAMKMALRGNTPIAHLVLCASAGIRRSRHFKRIVGLTLAKTGKLFLRLPGIRALEPVGKKLLYKLVRVHDYERANPVMRQTLINVTAEDFRPYLQHIAVPTDIVWGEDDGMTPVADARVLHEGIKDSALHVYPGVRHKVHKDKAPEIAAILRAALAETSG